MLETKELTVRFGGHVAVNAVSCAVAPGTLTAIVGANGAGKTTWAVPPPRRPPAPWGARPGKAETVGC